MFRKLITAGLAILCFVASTSPSWAARVELTNNTIEKLRNSPHAWENVRVYPGRTTIVERNAVSRDVVLREIIGRNTRGRIVAIEGRDSTALQSGSLPEPVTVYVSWNPDCDQKDCAFGFSRDAVVGSHNGYRLWEFTDAMYYLSNIPARPGYGSSPDVYAWSDHARIRLERTWEASTYTRPDSTAAQSGISLHVEWADIERAIPREKRESPEYETRRHPGIE